MKAKYKIRSLIQDSLNLTDRWNLGAPQHFVYTMRDYLVDATNDPAISVNYLAPPTHFEYTYPRCLSAGKEPTMFTRLIDKIRYTEFPSWAIITIENAQLYSDSALFTTPDQRSLFLDNGKHPGKTIPEVGSNALRKYTFRRIEKTAFLGFDRWASQYYYHWIIDALPRFLALKEIEFDGVVLLPHGVADFMIDALKQIGIDDTTFTFLEMEKRCKYQFDRLVYSQKRCVRNSPNPDALRKLKHALAPSSSVPSKSAPPKRIYVPRNKAKTRQLKNEDELIERLKPLGFHVAYCETLSMDEKYELFRDADIVIAPHSSGLTNIIFCKPGVHVIEIIQEDFVAEAFQAMACHLGFDHSYDLAQVKDGEAWLDIDSFLVNITPILDKVTS